MTLSRIYRSLSKSSRSSFFNATATHGSNGFVSRTTAIENQSNHHGEKLRFLSSYFSSSIVGASKQIHPSFPPICRPNYAISRFFSTDAPTKTNYEIKYGKGENDDQKNVLRPLSPHLPIYKPQSHSTLSILNRVSGIYLMGLFLAFHLACVKAGAICLTYPSFYEALFYSSKLTLVSLEIAAFATVYHLYHGIHHP